ncbi:unnamed protein product [Ilex paraguariensis]|uniref:HTH La-type RNA-binding domain-containing protein n=1 Tax=Ilex paraguariensis TaxID=185542 RepID=A0ABC8S8H3_9AQUA
MTMELKNQKEGIEVEAASAMVNGLKNTFGSDQTKSYELRTSQLKSLLKLSDDHEEDIIDALGSDLSKPTFILQGPLPSILVKIASESQELQVEKSGTTGAGCLSASDSLSLPVAETENITTSSVSPTTALFNSFSHTSIWQDPTSVVVSSNSCNNIVVASSSLLEVNSVAASNQPSRSKNSHNHNHLSNHHHHKADEHNEKVENHPNFPYRQNLFRDFHEVNSNCRFNPWRMNHCDPHVNNLAKNSARFVPPLPLPHVCPHPMTIAPYTHPLQPPFRGYDFLHHPHNSGVFPDFYLKDRMDQQGWVKVDLIARFPRIKKLTDDIQLILRALQPSHTVEVQGLNIRRRGSWMNWIQRC